jgi:hypothetical protein
MVSFKSLSLIAIAAGTALSAPFTTATTKDIVTARDGPQHYMDVIGYWRQRLGLGQLDYDGGLEANALNTVQESNGQLIHKLNPGSMGQVLAGGGGDLGSFESAFVGGWLCEIPSIPGLNTDGVCDSDANKIWGDHGGQTGHAEILTSGSYTKIGCGWSANVWGCDVA